MTNTFKGTKGKWYVSGDEYLRIESKNEGESKVETYPTIAVINTETNHHERGKANAVLIAHAPEMLEMLIKLNAAIDVYNNNMSDSNLKAINIIQRDSHDLITRAIIALA